MGMWKFIRLVFILDGSARTMSMNLTDANGRIPIDEPYQRQAPSHGIPQSLFPYVLCCQVRMRDLPS